MPEHELTPEEKMLHSEASSWRGLEMTKRLLLFVKGERYITRRQLEYGGTAEENQGYRKGATEAFDFVINTIEGGIEKDVSIDFEHEPILTAKERKAGDGQEQG